MLRRLPKFIMFLLFLIAVVLTGCDPAATATSTSSPPPTDPAPEPDRRVRMLSPQVNAGAPPNPPELVNNDWLGLIIGDVITTDGQGEAELQLAGCTGSIYVFMDSAIRASTCPESELTSGLSTCSANGTGYFNIECSDEFIVDTAGAQVLVTGTTFAVTQLREDDLTLVIALEGSVEVRPVIDLDTKELGAPITMQGGEFLYTTPGEDSRKLDGILPRLPQPIEEIGPVVNQFELQAWMARVEARATQDDLLPESWPLKDGEVVLEEETNETSSDNPGGLPLGPPGSLSISFLYGSFDDDRVKSAFLLSLDKEFAVGIAYPNTDTPLFANLEGDMVQINAVEYDPERALALLEEAGYAGGAGELVIYVPNSENSLYPFAEAFQRNLAEIGIETRLQFFTLLELDYIVEESRALGDPTIILRKPD